MDEETRAALARFNRQMGRVDGIDWQALALEVQANDLQRQLDASGAGNWALDAEATQAQIARLRIEAAELTQKADRVQGRLFETPSKEMQRQVQEWAERKPDDRERER